VTAEQWAAAAQTRPPKRKGTSIGLFLAIIVVIGLGTAGLVQVLTPAPPEPPCTTGRACSGPPAPSGGAPVDSGGPAPTATSSLPVGGTDNAPALVTGTTWTSSDLGFGVEYDPDGWSVADEDGRGALLGGIDQLQGASLWIAATPAGDATPAEALTARASALGDSIVGLAEDDRPESRIMGANIGYVDGVGAVYGGATDTPQGPGRRARVAVLSSSDGHLTITAACSTRRRGVPRPGRRAPWPAAVRRRPLTPAAWQARRAPPRPWTWARPHPKAR
jgi:hypothetical protein